MEDGENQTSVIQPKPMPLLARITLLALLGGFIGGAIALGAPPILATLFQRQQAVVIEAPTPVFAKEPAPLSGLATTSVTQAAPDPAFSQAQASDTIEAYKTYLAQNPEGMFRRTAEARMDVLLREAGLPAPRRAFADASASAFGQAPPNQSGPRKPSAAEARAAAEALEADRAQMLATMQQAAQEEEARRVAYERQVAAEEAEMRAQAAQVAQLQNMCDANHDRCEDRCDRADNAALAGALAGIVAGQRSSGSTGFSFRECTNRCDQEQNNCLAAAESGNSYRQKFRGGSVLGATAGGYMGDSASSGNGGNSWGGQGSITQGGGQGVNSAQCQAALEDAKREMPTPKSGPSICQSARDSIQMYEAGLRYLNRCPAADPTGADRAQYIAGMRQSKQTEAASCDR